MSDELKQPTPYIRPIRSFVRREGRLTPSQQSALDNYSDQYVLDKSALAEHIAQQTLPVSIDIGFGNGESLMHIASLQPEFLHLGIEVHRPGVGRLLNEIHKAQIDNIKVLNDDAVLVIDTLKDYSIDRFLIFFPDPWHKKRHNKRRLIQTKFVETLVSKLKPGGVIHLATDWQEYADHMLVVMSDVNSITNQAEAFSVAPTYRPKTKYERRGDRLGHEVFDLIFTKN